MKRRKDIGGDWVVRDSTISATPPYLSLPLTLSLFSYNSIIVPFTRSSVHTRINACHDAAAPVSITASRALRSYASPSSSPTV